MKHRTDIDGLRAIAVLPVVAYHAGLSQTPGGFVGVDVFFVISGYLITGIVAEELRRTAADGRPSMSLSGFYERRVRRIFPALLAMLTVTALAVSLMLTPREVVDFGKTLIAAIFSASNVLFWLDTNYFAQAAHQKPLLHTWSLAVEEQFYLIMPVALMLLWRWGGRRVAILALAAVAAVSFAWGWWGSLHQPTASFYLLHTRAWELAVGALLALGVVPAVRSRTMREALAAAGLAAILAAVFLYDAETPFPGVAALLPCLGTGAILHAGAWRPPEGEAFRRTLVDRLLSVWPARAFGLISYSLYLWHWPVIVLQRATFFLGEGLDPKLEKALMIGVSVALAAVSYWLVEEPFRRTTALSPRGRWFGRPALFLAAGAGALALTAAGLAMILGNGFPARMSAQANATAGYLAQDPRLTMKAPACLAGVGLREQIDQAACLTSAANRPNILLLGDSHAAHAWAALDTALPGANVLQAAAGGCRPAWPTASRDRICRETLRSLFEDWLPANRPDAVVLSARWEPADLEALPRTLEAFRRLGIPVVLLGPAPRYDQELPRLLIAAEQRNDPGLPARHRMAHVPAVDARLAQLAAEHGAAYVSPYEALCPAGRCLTRTPEGAPVQYDGGHLTLEGSRFLGQRIAGPLTAALAP